jgi:hypothetical protein
MSKTRSRRSANDPRTHRRSLVDLTEAMSRAVDDGVLASPAVPVDSAADHPPRSERAAERPARAEVPEQVAAPIPVTRAEAPKKPAARGSEPAASDSAAEMVVQIAKTYQNSVLNNVRAGLNVALDHAKEIVETKQADETAGDLVPEKSVLAAIGAATAAYRAEALALMQVNVATTLSFARDLAGARTAAEFVELSGTQARKSCELMLRQADILKSFAETVAKERGGLA